ncbi:hypothetical protein B6D12_02220 [Gilliamella apicola]|uniref:hypothetical protein n=1 Tax=Gilliamella TaxID=1193503 RepID=UPI0008105D72|nr:hypothetical protein [Gilliamella apicola]OCF92013.1 hypothetical protein A9G17_02225 [Gilliamella apicola]OTP88992.1 hypothetical protein B5S41_08190 [Gilliamella apicola]OTP94077.1 hypothetical protein B6D05_08575 [Gilliamella apicola]OTP96178.1 hypothetical protein B6D13_01470 [Gilliamella apicola]OTQ01555.1 hypothetical protein B6D07_08700 [Gilliamella apicola]
MKLGQKNNSNIDTQADKSVRLTIVDVLAKIERLTGARNIKLEPYQGWDKIRHEVRSEKR